MDTREKGRRGEELASRYLEGKGYRLVERNFQVRGGEIDLIFWDERRRELVFVEVKARKNFCCGRPEEALDDFKMERICAAGERYAAERGYKGFWRVDCVAIELDWTRRKAAIRHWKNIQ